MASTYSPNLRLELIATGEQQGYWGATTNTNLGTLLEEAIGGYVSVTVTDGADTTLSTNNGSADQSRNMTINLTGALTAARNVICPAIEKVYIVKNATTGGFAVTFKVSGQTGVSIPNGSTYILYVNGSDAVLATGTIAAQNSNNVSITGGSITGITDLAIADGGTGASTAAGAATNLGLGTGDSPQFAAVNIGNATDTTITRVSAGVIAVEGKTVVTETGGQTVQFAAGTVSAPSITTTGDTNTGIYFPSADTIAFTEGGAEAMRIDSSGNVGIGATTATSKVIISGSSGSAPTNITGNNILRLQSTQTAAVGVGPSLFFEGQTGNSTANYGFAAIQGAKASATASDYSGYLAFFTQDSNGGSALFERMRIDSSGNVGIGTTAGADKLCVGGATSDTWAANSAGLSINGVGTANSVSVISTFLDTTSIRIGAGATQKTGMLITGQASASGSTVQFSTGGSERMRINSSGNVGIGTSSPSYPLDVTAAIGQVSVSSTTGTNFARYLVQNTGGSFQYGIDSSTGSNYGFGAYARVIWNDGAYPIVFTTSSLERMRLDSSGNLGIGTSTFGTSAAKVLSIGTGTAPSTGPADTIQIFSTDLSAGNTILSLRTEGTPVNANTTAAATHRIAVRINGTVYYLLANTSA